MENPLVKYNFEFAEQKRLVSKIFTMMVRDHGVLDKHPNLHLDLFRLAVQNLAFFQPVFWYFVNSMSKEKYDSIDTASLISSSLNNELYIDKANIDHQEYEQELKSYVAQLLSLL